MADCTVEGTVDVGIGRRTSIAIKAEDNWGCVNDSRVGTDGWHFLPQTGNDVNGEIEQLEDETIIGTRASQPPLAGTNTITGGIDLTADPDKLGYPLYYTLGEVVSVSGTVSESGTGDFTHSFYPTDLDSIQNSLPSFSIMRKLDKFDLRMRGGRSETLSLDQGLGEVLTASWDVQPRTEEEPSDSEVPATSSIDTDPFKFRDGTIQTDISGALEEVAEIQDISFEIANNLEGDATINSGAYIGYLEAMGRDVTGSMTITYEDNLFYQAYQDSKEFEVVLEYTSDTTITASNDAKYLKVRFPLVRFTTAPVSVGGGDEVLTQDTDFRADYNATATQELADGTILEGFDIYAELYNDVDSGTYEN